MSQSPSDPNLPGGGYPPNQPPPAPNVGGYPAPGNLAGYPPPADAANYPQGAQPGYQQPGFAQSGQPQHGYPQPGFGQPAPAGSGFDPATVRKADWAVLGIGLLMLIFSFFGWVSSSATGPYAGLGSGSAGGWNSWWVIIQLILLAVLAIKAVQIFTGQLRKEIPPIALVAAGGALVLLYLIALIHIFSSYSASSEYASVGPGFGIWACLILSIGFAYFLALGAQNSGAKLPFAIPGPKDF